MRNLDLLLSDLGVYVWFGFVSFRFVWFLFGFVAFNYKVVVGVYFDAVPRDSINRRHAILRGV